MDRILIRGGRALKGRIRIGGAKNAALPLMTACLLSDEPLTLSNLPHLTDIATLARLLAQHGVEVSLEGGVEGGPTGNVMGLTARTITSTTAPWELVRKMRASVLVMGPLVARCGHAKVSLPGGCAIGARPVDIHIKGLMALGAEVDLQEGYIEVRAPKGLRGGRFVFPQISVGATENLLMAATLAKGETQLINAAREPEVTDLAHCLIAMGARIDGVGSDRLIIQGCPRLHRACHKVVADRIETGTYAVAAAITGGDIILTETDLDLLPGFAQILGEAGITVEKQEDGVRVARTAQIKGIDVMTEPFPGFPTDLQAQIIALLSIAEGASMVTETIFENRFMHVPELCRMGANINVHRASAMVRGVSALTGAPVMATDLRASVSLVLAGLAARGETIVHRVYHLDRGYERLEAKLAACGAEIERLHG